jgi:hypothetical protein
MESWQLERLKWEIELYYSTNKEHLKGKQSFHSIT